MIIGVTVKILGNSLCLNIRFFKHVPYFTASGQVSNVNLVPTIPHPVDKHISRVQ